MMTGWRHNKSVEICRIKNSSLLPLQKEVRIILKRVKIPLTSSNQMNKTSNEVKIILKRVKIPNKLPYQTNSKSIDIPISNNTDNHLVSNTMLLKQNQLADTGLDPILNVISENVDVSGIDPFRLKLIQEAIKSASISNETCRKSLKRKHDSDTQSYKRENLLADLKSLSASMSQLGNSIHLLFTGIQEINHFYKGCKCKSELQEECQCSR
ncbi:uncharacterized protein LOC127285030 isoform X2 [Leptopilina boulardi]|uniref:uncharacterized protein LOC127285030 isoform X2 n=1 Tax=Leptopilina boulardi TaxID=63433 RepID=UPI0021F5D04D|nr:uncharacterized protein LOC127285030 isoform X2 [Leptopilina boulardi]